MYVGGGGGGGVERGKGGGSFAAVTFRQGRPCGRNR